VIWFSALQLTKNQDFFSTNVQFQNFSGPENQKLEFQDFSGPVGTVVLCHCDHGSGQVSQKDICSNVAAARQCGEISYRLESLPGRLTECKLFLLNCKHTTTMCPKTTNKLAKEHVILIFFGIPQSTSGG